MAETIHLMGVVPRERARLLGREWAPLAAVPISPLLAPLIALHGDGWVLLSIAVDLTDVDRPELRGLVYDAPLVATTPLPTADETNTSGTIVATGTVDDVRSHLGLPTIASFQTGTAGQGVVVAVLDAGVSATQFPVVDGWTPDGGTAVGTGSQHGNMVAWDIRIAAPAVSFYDVGVLKGRQGQPPRLSDAYAGLLWLGERYAGAPAGSKTPQVVCCPWMATTDPFPPTDPRNYSHNPQHQFSVLVDALAGAGIAMVFAAGNCGLDGYDPSCGPNTQVGPGRSIRGANGAKRVLCVGAADVKRRILSESSPGPSTYREAKPDLCGFSAFAGYAGAIPDGGTSAASGVAAGAVALLLHDFPGKTAEQVYTALRATAADCGSNLPGFDDFWGAGTIDLARAHGYLANGAAAAAYEVPLVDLVDGVIGKAPGSCHWKIRRLCEDRQAVFEAVGLGDTERAAIESLDVERVAALLEVQMRHALTEALHGRSTLPPALAADGVADGACGDQRPRLLVNLIADLARSADARQAFHHDRTTFIRQDYALSPAARDLAERLTDGDVDQVCQAAKQEAVEALREPNLKAMYGNVQSFPGPWIDSFAPAAARLGERVEVTIEGRGFAAGKPMVVGLVERRMAGDPKVACPEGANVSQTIPGAWFDPALGERRKELFDEACALALAVPPPDSCGSNPGDINIEDSVKYTWPPELVPPRLRLGTVHLSERFDPDSSAPRFRIGVVFDLDPTRLVCGEYDLWVGYCNAPGCQGRAAVGPTTFTIRPGGS